MNTSMNRSLAKVLGPALLLTATLALPVESFGAPSPDPRAAAMDKDDKKNKQQRNANKAQRQQNRQQVQAQRQGNRRQVQAQRQQNRRQVQQQANKGQRQEARRQAAQFQAQRKAEQRAVQHQAQLQRQQASRQAQIRAQQQAQLRAQQDRNRQLQLQRQAEWRRQEARRQAEWRRQEARRQAELQRRNNRYYNNNRYYPGDRYAGNRRWYNNQYDQYYRSGERFHIDGFVVEENGYCSLLRDHRGHVFALVGNIGDIVQGDHLRLQGRVVGGEACDWRGTAFEVVQVKTLWDNNRHESASYDYQRDRYSFEEFLDNRY